MFHQLVIDPATGKTAAVQPHLGSVSLIFQSEHFLYHYQLSLLVHWLKNSVYEK